MKSGAYLHQLERKGYREDDILHRYTMDLREEGCIPVPYLSSVEFSTDGSLLFCAGYASDLDLLSRRRLEGDIMAHTRNRAGELCLAAYQQNKYLLRVYRFY